MTETTETPRQARDDNREINLEVKMECGCVVRVVDGVTKCDDSLCKDKEIVKYARQVLAVGALNEMIAEARR